MKISYKKQILACLCLLMAGKAYGAAYPDWLMALPEEEREAIMWEQRRALEAIEQGRQAAQVVPDAALIVQPVVPEAGGFEVPEGQIMIAGELYYTDGMTDRDIEYFKKHANNPEEQREFIFQLKHMCEKDGDQFPYRLVNPEQGVVGIAEEQEAARVAAEEQECPVCIDDKKLLGFSCCDYKMCGSCWNMVIKGATQSGLTQRAKCQGCRAEIVDDIPEGIYEEYEPSQDDDSKDLVVAKSRALKVEYDRILAINFIEAGIIKRCPQCSHPVTFDEDPGVQDVRCSGRAHQGVPGGYSFCVGCEKSSHRGQTCAQAIAAAAEVDKFIDTNEFKSCPQCSVPCELTTGCNYMVCTNKDKEGKSTCEKQEFCWFCKKTFSLFDERGGRKLGHPGSPHFCADAKKIEVVFPQKGQSLEDIRSYQAQGRRR